MRQLFLFRWIAPFSRSSHLVFISSFSSPFIIILDANIPIHTLQATPRYQTLVVLDLQFYSFALLCFVGKLWWIGPLCSFSSLGTVSIVRCPTCHYWAFRFIPFPSTRLRVLFTLLFLCFHSCCSTESLSTSLPPSFYSFWLFCCHGSQGRFPGRPKIFRSVEFG
jgi:hypothetical protein